MISKANSKTRQNVNALLALSQLPKELTFEQLNNASVLFSLDKEDILLMKDSCGLTLCEKSIFSISDKELMSYSALTDDRQYISELIRRKLIHVINLNDYQLSSVFAPTKLLVILDNRDLPAKQLDIMLNNLSRQDVHSTI